MSIEQLKQEPGPQPNAQGAQPFGPPKGRYFRRTLLRWYRANARRFPWRETRDPYHILLAEVLLQRTQAFQVKDVYERFTAAFPTPADLAAASPASLQEILRPLGLAKRVSTLKRMGERLVSAWRGAVPLEVAELMKLPGVGRYTAAATVCFAADARSAVVDANVIRVFARFFGVTSQKARPRDDVLMWRLAESLLPHSRATEYNRALIDFAALVCRPRIPLCSVCPLSRECCLGRQACGVT